MSLNFAALLCEDQQKLTVHCYPHYELNVSFYKGFPLHFAH